MRQVSEQDRKKFGSLYKKLEGIKEELKHSHSLDILQAIIIRYNLIDIKSDEITRHCASDHKALKKLSKIESRIDQLIFDALYKELETMKHELKHCNSSEQLDTLSQHHSKINTDTDAVLRHITKNLAAQTKILKLEKNIAEQLVNKKSEFSRKQENQMQIEDECDPTEPATIDLKNKHDDNVLIIENSAVSESSQHISSEQSPQLITKDEHPQIHRDTPSTAPSVIDTSNSKNNIELEAPKKPSDESSSTQLIFVEQKKEREFKLAQFDKILKQLINKRDEFHRHYPKQTSEDSKTAYGASYQLVKKLSGLSQSYKDGIINLKVFKEQATKEIREQRRGILSEHRGCKEMLANLLLAIGTLGVGYVLAALYTQRFMPIKLNTHTAECLDSALKSVEQFDSGFSPVN